MKKSIKLSIMSLLTVCLMAIGSGAAFAQTGIGDTKAQARSIFPNSNESPRLESINLIPMETSNFKVLTEEEFIQRRAEITGRSNSEIRNEIRRSISIQSNPTETEYREYYILVGLGGNVSAKAGVLTQVTKFTFGNSVYYRFSAVYGDTAYLTAYSGGQFTIVKNYAQAILEDDKNLVLAVSGYAETAVVNGVSSGMNLTGGELIQIGWSTESTSESTTYYRNHFNASDRVTQR